MNTERDNKYNALKIDLPSSIQNKFGEMYLYEKNAHIHSEWKNQRYDIRHMNKRILGIKNSVIDSEIKWHKEFTKAIGRQELYVNGYLTWSQEHCLEVIIFPGDLVHADGFNNTSSNSFIYPHHCY